MKFFKSDRIKRYLDRPLTWQFIVFWSICISLIAVAFIYGLHKMRIANSEVTNDQIVCNGCAPIPLPPDLPKTDTIAGVQPYQNIFQFKNSRLGSRATLGGQFILSISDTAFTFSRWTNNLAEIRQQRAEGFDYCRKHHMPFSQMSPLPSYTFVKAAVFKSDSLNSITFNYIKRFELGFNQLKRPLRIKDLDIQLNSQCMILSNYQPKGFLKIGGTCDTVILNGSKFHRMDLTTTSRLLMFNGIAIDSLSSIILAGNTKLSDLTGNGVLELKTARTSDVNAINITLKNVDLDHLKFPDYGVNFIVDPDTTQPYATKLRLYQQLVNHYTDIPQQKKKYDVQRIQLINTYEENRIANFVEWHWNFYGYDKNLIFVNSAILMMLCFLINLFFFKRLLSNGYEINEVKSAYERFVGPGRNWLIRGLAYFFYCLVYTAFIFWGLNLKIDKIKLSNKGLFAWIIGQYVIGIICLAYIANIIITK